LNNLEKSVKRGAESVEIKGEKVKGKNQIKYSVGVKVL
jgi:hypothetical protein